MSCGLPNPRRCHTCRRRRLKCDGGIPSCVKCTASGVECLGYGKLILWQQGVASRGKMMGKSFGQASPSKTIECRAIESGCTKSVIREHHTSPYSTLEDPFFADLNHDTKRYVAFFASNVCENMVYREGFSQGSFRTLIALSSRHPAILQIIVASSALYLYNVKTGNYICERSDLATASDTSLIPANTAARLYRDAMIARGRGLRLLIDMIADVQPDQTGLLATILAFINLELIHSGKNGWRPHVEVAIKILNRLIDLNDTNLSMGKSLNGNRWREWLMSELLVYCILAGAVLGVESFSEAPNNNDVTHALLVHSEENNYASCPAELLLLVLKMSRLQISESQRVHLGNDSSYSQMEFAAQLLQETESFNPELWAERLENRTKAGDYKERMHTASAYKAAVWIYISRNLPPASSSTDFTEMTKERFLQLFEIIQHLSQIDQEHPCFKASSWPIFVAGAEAADSKTRAWVVDRLLNIGKGCPWGYVGTMLELLQTLWQKRSTKQEADEPGKHSMDYNWVREVQSTQVDWLII